MKKPPYMAFEPYIITALVAFILVLLFIRPRHSLYWLLHSRPPLDNKDRYRQDRFLCHHTKKCLHYLHKESRTLKNNPELAENILERLRFLLPAKAIFTEQRIHLHDILLFLHKKHMAGYAKQSSLVTERQETIPALTDGFNQLAAVKNRLLRLDRAAAEQEKKIKCLLQLAQNFAAARHTKQFRTCIKIAKEFQNSNIRLLKAIHKTEKKLSAVAGNFNSSKNETKLL